MDRTPAQQALEQGQSIWYDNIRRGLLASGELARLVEQGVTGVTSNPAIFEKAISGSTDYDQALAEQVAAGKTVDDIYTDFVVEDIRRTADLLRPIWEASQGHDGFVSVEVSPRLAHDTAGTVAEAQKLAKLIQRPNLLVKVPATPEGIPAIRGLVAQGISVNVTLIFSLAQYDAVAQAYIAGLDERARGGHDIGRIASVASFFVSRIDTACDGRLVALMKEARSADPARAARAESLLGRVGIANARVAYARFHEIFNGPSFTALARRGAQRQRMLWASTGVKNPTYRDTYYVEELIGPDTVDTVPPATLTAFLDHGKVARTIDTDVERARADLAALGELGLNLEQVCAELLAEGVTAFAQSMAKLMDVIRARREAMLEKSPERLEVRVPGKIDADAVARGLDRLDDEKAAPRLWERDATFFADGPVHRAEVKSRLDWLDLPERMVGREDELYRFVAEARADGIEQAVVLGIGGATLAAEVLTRVFGTAPGAIPVTILDSTDPAAVLDTELQIDLPKTLFLVASKSGTTVETRALAAYFLDRARSEIGAEAGRHFVAVTDPDTPLVELARSASFRAVFAAPPQLAGRYSALSYFGLLPAALAGVDVAALVDDAHRMAVGSASCIPAHDSPALRLGSAIGELAGVGRNKLTLLASPEIAPLGTWIEQLVSESTGKDGKGIVTVDGEPVGAPAVYGDDRQFVYLRFGGRAPQPLDDTAAKLLAAGFPVSRIGHLDRFDLGGEIFRWELATVVAARALGVYPFDEPGVEEARRAVRTALSEPPAAEPGATVGEAIAFLRGAVTGEYVALCPFFHRTPRREAALERLRIAVRDRSRSATTLAWGPRYLHAAGQLHKQGPAAVRILQITAEPDQDLAIPGEKLTFGQLLALQAAVDRQLLARRGRPVVRVHLGKDVDSELEALAAAIVKGLG